MVAAKTQGGGAVCGLERVYRCFLQFTMRNLFFHVCTCKSEISMSISCCNGCEFTSRFIIAVTRDGKEMIWYDVIWYGMAWYGVIWWYDMIRYDMTWHDMIWYGMIWCDMIWYDMIWCDMIWYDVIWYVDAEPFKKNPLVSLCWHQWKYANKIKSVCQVIIESGRRSIKSIDSVASRECGKSGLNKRNP
jgi:hypothetical protein